MFHVKAKEAQKQIELEPRRRGGRRWLKPALRKWPEQCKAPAKWQRVTLRVISVA